MPRILAIICKFCRFWWLTIALPARERRAQAIWEAAEDDASYVCMSQACPGCRVDVPLPMGHISLQGLWLDWGSVARVSAAHNRRVDDYLQEHGGPVGATIVLEPDPLPYFPGWLKPPDSSPGRFDWAAAIGGVAYPLSVLMRARQASEKAPTYVSTHYFDGIN